MNMLAEAMRVSSSSGNSGLIQNLLAFLGIGICLAAIWAVGRWFILRFKLPELAMTAWTGIFILIGLVVFINFVLSLFGNGFIHYW